MCWAPTSVPCIQVCSKFALASCEGSTVISIPQIQKPSLDSGQLTFSGSFGKSEANLQAQLWLTRDSTSLIAALWDGWIYRRQLRYGHHTVSVPSSSYCLHMFFISSQLKLQEGRDSVAHALTQPSSPVAAAVLGTLPSCHFQFPSNSPALLYLPCFSPYTCFFFFKLAFSL